MLRARVRPRAKRPATMRRSIEKVICATSSVLRRRWRFVPAVSDLSAGTSSGLVACTPGTRPATMPASVATPNENANTRQSMLASNAS